MTQLFFPMLGGVLALTMLLFAFSGPSQAKAQKRRLNNLLERHGRATAVTAEDKLRRITGAQDTRMDSLAARFLPRPALLKKRLAMTGKDWSVGQYAMANVAITVVFGGALILKGAPALLGLFGGLMVGIGF